MTKPLSAEQESRARELSQSIAEVTQAELDEIARTLAATDDADLFGNTEFKIRALALKIAAKAYERRLAQKKTATLPPA